MTLVETSRTILIEAAPDDGVPYVVPFGRTGCCLLPDGTYLTSVVIEKDTTSTLMIWKISGAGAILGSLEIDAVTATVGRAHLIALDGFLVQALFMTGTSTGGASYLLDVSDDTPVLLATYADATDTSGYGGSCRSAYMRGPGVVFVTHAEGISTYRRGRPIYSIRGDFGGGEHHGPYLHPSDPYKIAWWGEPATSTTTDHRAYEATVHDDGVPVVTQLGIEIVNADTWWLVGPGSPYAATPLAMHSNSTDVFEVVTAADPTTPLWTDTLSGDIAGAWINADPASYGVGLGPDRFLFLCEMNLENGTWPSPTGPAFVIRVMLVDNTTGTPTVEQVDLEYGATSPHAAHHAMYYVSLITGSMCINHRDGEIVVSTCVVEQESDVGSTVDYYSVISWKLTGGDLAALSGLDGAWRTGINNADGRLGLESTDGMLIEAGEALGPDAPAQPAYVKTSDGWEVLGRFVDTSLPDLPEPATPTFLDVTYEPASINTDLAAAQALAGASFVSGGTWGPFVAQASPPTAGDLVDGSDATITTLVQPVSGGPSVEVFTARMVPDTAIPPGAVPYRAAWTFRARAGAGSTGANYLDGLVTVPTSQINIRGRNLFTAFNLGPALSTDSYGSGMRYNTPADSPPRLESAYTQAQSLEVAFGKSYDTAAQWWHDFLDDPAAYVVVQAAATNPASGNLELAELTFTIRYIIP